MNDGEEVWQSLGNTTITPMNTTFESDDGETLQMFSISSTTDHLTSFAVLLGASLTVGCSNRVLWIVSLALIGAAAGTFISLRYVL